VVTADRRYPMTESVIADVRLPNDRPPKWVNSFVKWALETPGLQGTMGQGLALLSFTGHKTGKAYTIPVSYHREADTVTIITKKQRNWWRNFEVPAEVHVRLAGKDYQGKAEARVGDDEELEFMLAHLAKRPVDAKAYGIARGEIAKAKIAPILPQLVFIRITVTPTE
jgi:hypothetical protein